MKTHATCIPILIGIAGLVAAASRTTWDGVFTEEQALDGDVVYQERCSTCHGPNLEGGEDAPPLVGTQFSGVWEGRTLADLLSRMQGTMPKDAPGSLGLDDYTNIVAFVLRRNGFPAGTQKLPHDTAALSSIRYRTAAP